MDQSTMPYVELESSNVSLFYRSNFSKFNPSKSTILLLPGIFASVDFLSPQFEDERFAGKYNMIAFDQLSCGKTVNPVDARKDANVEAGAIMLGLEKLGLKDIQFHVFAAQGISQQIALRIAQTWSDRVLSLFFCGIGGFNNETQWFEELFSSWANATSKAELDAAVAGMLSYAVGDDDRTCTAEEKDQLVDYWLDTYPPNHRAKMWNVGAELSQKTLSAEELKAVKQPSMVLHGASHAVYPAELAESFSSSLPKSQLKLIPDGSDSLQYPVYFANKFVNPAYEDFLTALEEEDEDIVWGARSRSGTFSARYEVNEAEWLKTHGAVEGQGVWGLSKLSEGEVKKADETLKQLAMGQENAYSPALGDTKWSNRNLDSMGVHHSDDEDKVFINGAGIMRRPSGTDWLQSVEKVTEHTPDNP